MSWKRIADEMPPEKTAVLCYGRNRMDQEENMGVMSWHVIGASVWWSLEGMGGYECECDIEPTHWQPLPPAPKVI